MTVVMHTDMTRQIRRAMRSLLKRKQALQIIAKLLQSQKTLSAVLSEKIPFTLETSTQTIPATTKLSHSEQTIRVCQLSEYKAVALSLAHAFADDPCAMFCVETEDRRHWTPQQKWDLHVEIMEYVVYAHMLDGVVTTIGDDYGAVALW